ncbi:MAG TPA: ATP-binding cassette domain-containing protein [Mycobacteriales bacterium]
MIEARGLTKRYGKTLAVDDLSFTVEPGTVTGFLGPNGAGKSTTMRMILGLDRPNAGSALVNGHPFVDSSHPMREVGALLEAKSAHPGLKARDHLRGLAQSNRLPAKRVDDVLALTGMSDAANRRIKGLSLGMTQRLGLAAAMLGDPSVLLFDEPVNGLDPEGIRWIRTFMQSLAAEGRTVLVSSHLMSEMAVTAERLVVIGRGRLIADTSTKEFIQGSSNNSVRVRSPRQDALKEALEKAGHATRDADGFLEIIGMTTDEVGELAWKAKVPVHELFEENASLEEAFMELTRDSVEFHAGAPTTPEGSA